MPRPALVCGGCARGFEVSESFQAYLFESAAGYERRDYCLACPADAGAALAHWRARRSESAPRKAAPLDRALLLSMVERLEGASDPGKRRFRFVLALLLWQKKVLTLRSTTQTLDGEVWNFETRRGEAAYAVHDPVLAESELGHLSEQLDRLLAGDAAASQELSLEALDA